MTTGLRTMMLLFLAVLTGSFALLQPVPVGAVQTTTQYCSQYTSNSKLNACKDGIRGADCTDYAITFDQATADICTKAAKAKADGQISDTPPVNPSTSTDAEVYKNVISNACSVYHSDATAALWCMYGGLGQNGTEGKPKSTADCLNKPEIKGSTRNQSACVTGSSAGRAYLAEKSGNTDEANNINADANSMQDVLDQTGNLSQFLDILHALGKDSKVDVNKQPDNTYGFYVNGAGKLQAITPILSGRPNSPAIIFFNGGGWHGNDGVSHCVAVGTPGNLPACPVGGAGGGGGDNLPPAGGGALARGFTVFDATYRYGSSGVYYQFEDVMRAIQHVRNNAAMYGVDPNKIAIWGDSAGGSLSMRANASGKSGAKVAVGWSAPTNAYTGLFKSYKSLLIGMDHSTCIPTDLAGLTNITSLLNGGSGNVAEYGQGLSSNGLDSFTGGNPLNLLTDVLTAGQYALQTSQNVEAISSQLESGGILGMSGGVINLAANKFVECIDNFNALSPALFASPDSSPAFLGGFDSDDVVDPQQAYDMRDKLRSLGIRSDALVLQGDPNGAFQLFGPNLGNHLGYDSRFVCASLNFIDDVMQTGRHVDCVSGI
ncbi:alpha/beta hydrolase [Candidatus Saccharibacteria bacterium]|nr:alpha/beta hydrolase [Candidatus Saccharibacteria bacterium]